MAIHRNAANSRSPFSITRLNGIRIANPIGARNHHLGPDHTYYKASLVEVIEIAVLDGVLRMYVGD